MIRPGAILAALIAAFLALPAAAVAGETSPYYPGSTLEISLAKGKKAIAGRVTTLIARGTNVSGEVDFGLEVYAKNAKQDPTCAPNADEELQTSINVPTESQIFASTGAEGNGPFEVRIKAVFNPVRVLICAYSRYIVDTAANDFYSFSAVRPPRHNHR